MAYAQLHGDHFDDDRRISCEDPEVVVAELVLATLTKRLESDGRVTRLQARKELAGLAFIRDPGGIIDKLVAAKLAVLLDEQTIELSDWSRFTASAEEMNRLRADRAAAGRRGAAARWGTDPDPQILPQMASAKGTDGKPHEDGTCHGIERQVPSDPMANGDGLPSRVMANRTEPNGREGNGTDTTPPRAASASSNVSSSVVVVAGLLEAAKRLAVDADARGAVTTTPERYADGVVKKFHEDRADEIERAEREQWPLDRVVAHFGPQTTRTERVPVGARATCDAERCGSRCQFGYGRDACSHYRAAEWTEARRQCDTCRGDRMIEDDDRLYACPDCGGSGFADHTAEIIELPGAVAS